MLARQRQDVILEQVARDGGARVADLVERLGVSDMTVRRDIQVLAERGLVARVHGGAAAVSEHFTADEPEFKVKSELQLAEKRAIARAAAGLVEPGSSVALSAGSTTYAVAEALCAVPRLTVITNSLPVADMLHSSDSPGHLGRAHRRHAHPLRRARRSGRPRSPARPARRLAVPRRPRHGPPCRARPART